MSHNYHLDIWNHVTPVVTVAAQAFALVFSWQHGDGRQQALTIIDVHGIRGIHGPGDANFSTRISDLFVHRLCRKLSQPTRRAPTPKLAANWWRPQDGGTVSQKQGLFHFYHTTLHLIILGPGNLRNCPFCMWHPIVSLAGCEKKPGQPPTTMIMEGYLGRSSKSFTDGATSASKVHRSR